jgi:hypothetical protein
MEQTEDPLGSPKRHEKVVYIFNMSEDVWPFISAMKDPNAKAFEIEDNVQMADRELFAVADEPDSVFIAPKPIDPQFVQYFQDLTGIRQVTILAPKVHTGLICEDILRDEALMAKLIAAANSVKKLTLISYSVTPQFFRLVHELKRRGISVYTPEAPEEDAAWTVNFFGSKSGIRQLAQQSAAQEPDFRMADGVIVSGLIDAAKIAANKFVKEHGVVIKTNKGHSGVGVLIFREKDLPESYAECEAAIMKVFERDGYWEQYPIVIESLIRVNQAVGGGFPNVEYRITKSGEVKYLYPCGLRVMDNGTFKGVEINEEVMNERIMARVIDTGFFIGERYAAAGYRGYFDVDFIAAKNGEIYVTESNTRRTGGTHVYAASQRLIGKEFESERYVLSDNSYKFADGHIPTFARTLEILKPVLFNKTKKEGVVLTYSSLLRQGRLGYIIFGENEKRALEIERQMEELLASL